MLLYFHYTIEDTELTEKLIIEIFGKEIAKHVEGLTRIKTSRTNQCRGKLKPIN